MVAASLLARAISGAVLFLAMASGVLACAVPSGHVGLNGQLAQGINTAREQAGLGALPRSARLDRAARDIACDNAARGRLSHRSGSGSDLSARLQKAGYGFRAAGENLGQGYRSPARAVQGWMNSPGHRQNLLSPQVRELGVAVALGTNGTRFYAMVAAAPR